MRDTRPVHMGTYEINKKHTDTEINILKSDIKDLRYSMNRLTNKMANDAVTSRRRAIGLLIISIINALAISLILIL